MTQAWQEGYAATSAYDNPYWLNYPHRSTEADEIAARQWVDGYVAKIIECAKAPDSLLPRP